MPQTLLKSLYSLVLLSLSFFLTLSFPFSPYLTLFALCCSVSCSVIIYFISSLCLSFIHILTLTLLTLLSPSLFATLPPAHTLVLRLFIAHLAKLADCAHI